VATTATADEAAAAGAIVEMTFLYAGFDDPALERDEISRNAVMVRTCERIGILYMIEPLSARTDATGRTSRPGRRLATQDENPLCQHRVRCCAASDY
jgi:hypothetical protein